jgi:hypothetical protein
MDDGRFPVYRLIDGQVMYQARCGDRWSPVEDAVVARMFRIFDGIPLDVLRSEQSLGLTSATALAAFRDQLDRGGGADVKRHM